MAAGAELQCAAICFRRMHYFNYFADFCFKCIVLKSMQMQDSGLFSSIPGDCTPKNPSCLRNPGAIDEEIQQQTGAKGHHKTTVVM
jgi:hypothetical protein